GTRQDRPAVATRFVLSDLRISAKCRHTIGMPSAPTDCDAVSFPPNWELPAFDVHKFSRRRRNHALCVFVLNEGERIRRQLRRMRGYCGGVDLIVADGGSSDDALNHDYLTSCGVRALLVKTGAGGLSAQLRMALAYCICDGYEGVVVMDGNDKDG